MASAATLGLLALGTSATGVAVQTISQRNAAKFESEVAKQNAEAARLDAEANASRVERDRSRKRAAQRAAFGASGVDVNSGSALAVQIDQILESALDVETTRARGNLQARGFDVQSRSASSRGRNATLSGVLSGVSTAAQGTFALSEAGLLSSGGNTATIPTNIK